MIKQHDIYELNATLIDNFRLKAKILSVLFGTVLFLQFGVLGYMLTTDLPGRVIPYKMMIVGPSLMLISFAGEVLAFHYMTRARDTKRQIKTSFAYMSTFVEVSFPCVMMLVSGNFLRGMNVLQPMQVVNSPLLIILFIMIVLSSLLLNRRLSLFAGLVAGVEYLLVNLYFLRMEPAAGVVDYGNATLKSMLIVVAGLLAGFVSGKVREAVLASLEAKNELIHHLDQRVAEKTAEVMAKNRLLEEKQKEILDSIHYARRIQYTQLPTEKYINRVLSGVSRSSQAGRIG